MQYRETITIKDGRSCLLRNGTEVDAKALLDVFVLTHGQTDYLLTYADECTMTVDDEASYLKEMTESPLRLPVPVHDQEPEQQEAQKPDGKADQEDRRCIPFCRPVLGYRAQP